MLYFNWVSAMKKIEKIVDNKLKNIKNAVLKTNSTNTDIEIDITDIVKNEVNKNNTHSINDIINKDSIHELLILEISKLFKEKAIHKCMKLIDLIINKTTSDTMLFQIALLCYKYKHYNKCIECCEKALNIIELDITLQLKNKCLTKLNK